MAEVVDHDLVLVGVVGYLRHVAAIAQVIQVSSSAKIEVFAVGNVGANDWLCHLLITVFVDQ